jgi:hypothetical protein
MYWTEQYNFTEVPGISQRGDLLGPLNSSLDRAIVLAQLVESFELELFEVELRGINKELDNSKGKAQTLARPCMRSENPAIAGKVHELALEADEVVLRAEADPQAAETSGYEPGGVRDKQCRDASSRGPGELPRHGQWI